MSLLQYTPPGGTTIALNLIKQHGWTREVVYNGPNYVYTRHRLVVRAVFNPGTQTGVLTGLPAVTISGGRLTRAGGPLPFVPPAPVDPGIIGPVTGQRIGLTGLGGPDPSNVPAVVSEAALRHDLAQPRGQLVYSIGGQPSLVSPLPGFQVDCTNGPRPFYFNIVDILGPRTFIVDYGIETDLNEQFSRSSPGRNVLSHTWSMEHVLDQDFFTKRVINGEVVFNAAFLSKNGLTRDDFRRLLFHPIPQNMKRLQVHVRAKPDGYTYEYQIVDQELPVNWGMNGVTRLEAYHTLAIHQGTSEGEMLRRTDTLTGSRILENIPLAGPLAGAVLDLGRDFLRNASVVSTNEIKVRLWGRRTSTRQGLHTVGLQIINQRVAAINRLARATSGRVFVATHDVAGKFVELTSRFWMGPVASQIVFAGGTSSTAVFDIMTPSGSDNTGTVLVTGNGTQSEPPPDDNISRGTFIESCIGGALVNPGQAATANPTEPDTNDAAPSTM